MSSNLINEDAVKSKLSEIVESQMITILTAFVKRDWDDQYSSSRLKDHLTMVVQSLYDEATDDEVIALQEQITVKSLELKKLRLKKKISEMEKQLSKLSE